MQHRFLYLAEFAFWTGQDAESEAADPSDPLKHRFLELAHFAFYASQKAENKNVLPLDPFIRSVLYVTQAARLIGEKEGN